MICFNTKRIGTNEKETFYNYNFVLDKLFTDIIAKDSKISSEAQVEEVMREALQRLMNIREEYNLPRTCS